MTIFLPALIVILIVVVSPHIIKKFRNLDDEERAETIVDGTKTVLDVIQYSSILVFLILIGCIIMWWE